MRSPPEPAAELHQPAQYRTGLLAGLVAYALWGVLPLYFVLLKHVAPLEVVAHRVIWSVAFLTLLLAVNRLFPAFLGAVRRPRIVGALLISAVLIAANWLIYIWAVATNHVVAASLGYFLNPLVVVMMGTLLLKEKLRRGQLIAVLIAAIGVALLAMGELQTLWISLSLATTFAIYGLVRKLTPVPSAVGLMIETLLLTLPSLLALGWIAQHGGLSIGRDVPTTALLIALGAITSVPLLLFAVAARALPMVAMGLMQYIAPTLQFLSGVFILGEHLSPERWASFVLIWAALALFVGDSLRGARAARTATDNA